MGSSSSKNHIIVEWINFIILNVILLTLPFAISKIFERPNLSEEIYLQFAVLFFALFYLFARFIMQAKLKMRFNYLDVSILLFYLALLLSTLNSRNILYSLKQSVFPLVLIIVYFLSQGVLYDRKKIRFISFNILFVSSIIAIYGILQYFGFEILGYELKKRTGKLYVLATLGHPNYVSAYLLIVIMYAAGYFYFAENKMLSKLLAFCYAILLFICILLTGARGSWFGFIIGAIYLVIMLHYYLKVKLFKSRILMAMVYLFIITSILFLSFPNPLTKDRFILTKRLQSTSELRSRFYSWQIAIQMFKRHPLIGVGYGNYGVEYWDFVNEFQKKEENKIYDYLLTKNKGIPPGLAHNEYLQIAAEGGIIGISTFILFLVIFLQYIFTAMRSGMELYKKEILLFTSAGIIALLIDCLFSFSLHLPISGFYFWLFLGIFNAIYKTECEVIEPPPAVQPVKTKKKK